MSVKFMTELMAKCGIFGYGNEHIKMEFEHNAIHVMLGPVWEQLIWLAPISLVDLLMPHLK